MSAMLRRPAALLSLAAVALCLFPTAALAGATVNGAVHAVVRAVAEEGGTAIYYGTPQVHCRRTAPSRFGCSFLNLTRGRSGRVSVSYIHRHYFVGEPRYEQRSQPSYEPLCGTVYNC